jgi:hypothetical protein
MQVEAFMKLLLIRLFLIVNLFFPVYAQEQNPDEQFQSFEQLFVDMLIESTIIAFENPETRQELSNLSEMIKDEQTYQYMMERIDKFIIVNELEKYKQQAEELKAFITESRELYMQSEKETIEKYNQLKQEQQQREKQKQFRDANVIEV